MEPLKPDEDELADREALTGGTRAEGGRARGKGDKGGGVRSATLWLLFVLILVIGAGTGWKLWQQQQQLTALDHELEQALSIVRYTRRELGAVNRERSETGETVSEKLSTLDSEMRKLWVIAHQTNQPAIESVEKKVASIEQSLPGLEQKVASLTERAESMTSRITAVREDLAGRVNEFEQSWRLAQEKVTARIESLEKKMPARVESLEKKATARIESLEKKVTARVESLEKKVESGTASRELETDLKNLSDRVAELQSVVDSIDSARSQLTQRFIQLRDRVDSLSGKNEE